LNNIERIIAAALLGAAIGTAVFVAQDGVEQATAPVIPQCVEDAVLVGKAGSEFEGGRYTEYECGPSMDDYDASR
jgi:hypothetical protein